MSVCGKIGFLFSLVLIAGVASANSTPPESYRPSDIIGGAWLVYRDRYVEDDGRVVDTRANGISHSEGQGYGMLMAVRANEKRDFDRIWAWTEANLYGGGNGLAAWRWDPASTPHVTDSNNATDGDLLIAWALSQAGNLWKEPVYTQRARKIVAAISSNLLLQTDFGTVLLPAAQGFTGDQQPDGPVVNLSYWIFPAIADLGELSSSFPAADLIQTGLNLTRLARFGHAELPSDWISLKGKLPSPAVKYPPQFGYDAIRVPLYIAWYSRDYPDILEPFERQWGGSDSRPVSVVELETGLRVSPMPDAGYTSVALLVQCSLGINRNADRVSIFEPTDYYPSTLQVLSLMALTERYPRCLADPQ